MDGKIVYKSTSEFLKYISNKAKGKSNNQMTKTSKHTKVKKSNNLPIQTGKLNFQ
ncbi:MAG: hypothetical protein U0354_12690 [Candidatus Sericytochromatia bacterium]